MLGLHPIAANLGPIYELKDSGFLGLVNNRLTFIVRTQASIYTSMSGSDWHASKVYNWPSNKSDLQPHQDRHTSSHPRTPFLSLSA